AGPVRGITTALRRWIWWWWRLFRRRRIGRRWRRFGRLVTRVGDMSSPLSEDDRQRIHAVIEEIERREGIDIAVIVTRLSDRYAAYPLIWAALLTFSASALFAVVHPRMPLPIALLTQLLTLTAFAI